MNDQTLLTKKRCLLIAPLSFYSFHRTVAQGLERRGYEVEMLNEEFPANSFGKVLGKLALPLLRRLTLRGIKTRLDGKKAYDLVLIIKGRGLGVESLAYLKTKSRRIVGYNFDSFLFNPSPLDWYHLTDRYATFDISDAKKRGIPLVHLFSAAVNLDPKEQCYDISIIQRVHSDRLKYAYMILQSLPKSMTHFVFLFESNPLTFLLHILQHPLLYKKLWKYISFSPLPYVDAMRILSQSSVTFDYAHPLQTGITIRCFEAYSLGVSVITNNIYAVEDSVFESGSIVHLPMNSDRSSVLKLINSLSRNRSVSKYRSLDDFLAELID